MKLLVPALLCLAVQAALSSEWRFYENGEMKMNVTAQYARIR